MTRHAGFAHAPTDVARVPGARFIDPAVLARIGNLDLVARITVDGFVSGLHRTRQLGVSTEFAEHRGYTPGDDVRHIDWKVFARSDRLYVKTYEAETNADLVLALDVSASMNFGAALSKFDYARFSAASLARLAAGQGDRVGLAAFGSDLVDWIPPAGRQRDRLFIALENLMPGGGSDLAASLDRIGAGLSRRGIVVVLSDFYAAPDAVVKALDGLRLRGHDVIALHVLDPVERDLGSDARVGDPVLEDLESGERVAVDIPGQREAYRHEVERHIARLDDEGGARGIHYGLFDTGEPLDFVLSRFLSIRTRLARVR